MSRAKSSWTRMALTAPRRATDASYRPSHALSSTSHTCTASTCAPTSTMRSTLRSPTWSPASRCRPHSHWWTSSPSSRPHTTSSLRSTSRPSLLCGPCGSSSTRWPTHQAFSATSRRARRWRRSSLRVPCTTCRARTPSTPASATAAFAMTTTRMSRDPPTMIGHASRIDSASTRAHGLLCGQHHCRSRRRLSFRRH